MERQNCPENLELKSEGKKSFLVVMSQCMVYEQKCMRPSLDERNLTWF